MSQAAVLLLSFCCVALFGVRNFIEQKQDHNQKKEVTIKSLIVQKVLQTIRTDLVEFFDEVFGWFDSNDNLLGYSPGNGGWTIKQILEHISLTNHYLLIIIRKGVRKAIEKSKIGGKDDLLVGYDLDWDRLKLIGEHRSFEWNRPDHMEPAGELSLREIKTSLESQLEECLKLLDDIRNGEGTLHKTTMTVNDLGKIDVYHYIYFLAQHARPHLSQMQKVKLEFENNKDERT